jgi:hypothetical protein
MSSPKFVAFPEIVHGLLIDYPGYIGASINGLTDNSGSAVLISAMEAHGKKLLVFDYASTETIRSLRPPEIQARLEKIWPHIERAITQDIRPPLSVIIDLFRVNRRAASIQLKVEKQIAAGLIRDIEQQKPLFLGAKLWMGDGFLGSMRILKIIHERFPGLPIVAGGPVVASVQGTLLKEYPQLTYAIRGEADLALPYFVEFLQGQRSRANVPNLIFRQEDRSIGQTATCQIEELNALPLPDYSRKA